MKVTNEVVSVGSGMSRRSVGSRFWRIRNNWSRTSVVPVALHRRNIPCAYSLGVRPRRTSSHSYVCLSSWRRASVRLGLKRRVIMENHPSWSGTWFIRRFSSVVSSCEYHRSASPRRQLWMFARTTASDFRSIRSVIRSTNVCTSE